MTANQIAYWNLEELKRHNRRVADENERHNRATEYESYRHSYAQEVEANRHNLMAENLENNRNVEVRRHNVATEGETQRSNVINERINQLRHEETVRANQAALAESTRHNMANEYANMLGVGASQMSARAAQLQAGIASRHVAVEEQLLPYQQSVQTATANNINSQADLNRARIPGVLYAGQITGKELQTWNTTYNLSNAGKVLNLETSRINNAKGVQDVKKSAAEANIKEYEMKTQPTWDQIKAKQSSVKILGDVIDIVGNIFGNITNKSTTNFIKQQLK